jgi:hypothetical protein
MMQPIENDVIMNSEQQMETKPTLSRRKFIVRAGAGSLPVVMSLQSGSAWGCVELNCAPGQTSLSASGSQVASVTANKTAAPYKRPQWSNMSEIISAFNVDFDAWLLDTYKKPLTYRKLTTQKDSSGRSLYSFTAISKSNFTTWWNNVRVGGNTNTLYTNAPGTMCIASSCAPYNKANTRQPGNFNGFLVVSNTNCTDICTGMSGKVGTVLKGIDCPERSVIGALIGSIWERHPEYIARYGDKKCFPEPSILVAAYTKAKTQGKLSELHSLIKLYMSPLK